MNPIKRLNLWIYKNTSLISRLVDVWVVIFLILLVSLIFGKPFRKIITIWSFLGILFLYTHYLCNWYYKGKRKPKGNELEQISTRLPTKLDLWIVERRNKIIKIFLLYIVFLSFFCILYLYGLPSKFVLVWYFLSLIFVYPLFVIYWYRTGEIKFQDETKRNSP